MIFWISFNEFVCLKTRSIDQETDGFAEPILSLCVKRV